jgi:hypothetical protein
MPSQTNYYAFCADYSDTATCLFAIQNLSDSGALSAYPELQRMLRVFEQSTLLKLYVRTLTILGEIDGIAKPPEGYSLIDFYSVDFFNIDFSTGSLIGDFIAVDFNTDFKLNLLDTTKPGFASMFQTILNIFKVFKIRINEINTAEIPGLDSSLEEVLYAIAQIRAYLYSIGLNPCVAVQNIYRNNSTDVYLQAAGADGTDGVAEGIHLRWSFAGELGQNHLAKGDYDNNISQPVNFNQANDYVTIYRTPYTSPVNNSINLQQVKPSINYSIKQWAYVINQEVNGHSLSNRVTLTFTDAGLYDQIAAVNDPNTAFFNFLKAYTGVVKIQVENKTAYRFDFDYHNESEAATILKIEAQCLADTESTVVETVFARQTVTAATGTNENAVIFGENIQSVSLKMSPGSFIQSFSFETYHDFLTTRTDADWTTVGNGFSLSLTNQQVFDRLETTAYPIDNLWPQYRDGTKVKVANYKDKWTTSYPNEPSIKQVVTDYLLLSETDPRAMVVLNNETDPEGTPGLSFSYLDLLNIAASDYHIARMLGLGCIDVFSEGTGNDTYVYRLSYTNRTGLNSSTVLARSYMTLPTAKTDSRLPLKPQIKPISYGLPVTSTASQAFNDQGYAVIGNKRAVNIGRQPFNDEITGYDFFADLFQTDNTNIFKNSRPVRYGIEYRPASQPGYVKPEITQNLSFGVQYYAYDPAYPDTGIPETVPVADDPVSLYVHMEKQEGVHFYAIYGINWFSRASELGDEVATDDTAFPAKNTLHPPTDVSVQYIQKEDPLVFTTAQEQAWLAGRNTAFPDQDINFTRIVFNWLDIVDISALQNTSATELLKVVRANTVNIYFNPNTPVEVTGIIKNMAAVAGNDTQLLLFTAPYTKIDGTVVSPFIPETEFFRFNNSLLNTPGGQFKVIAIAQGATWPVITIEKTVQNSVAEDSLEQGNYGLQQTYTSPSTGDRFTMFENLSNAENWQTVTEGVSLYSFADPYNPVVESFTDSEGNITQNWIGGLSANAVVTALFSDNGGPSDLPGYYQVTFPQSLPPNPQVNLPFDPANPGNNAPGALHSPHVEWYKGWVRVTPASGGDDKKQLEVLRIVQTDPLIIIIYDAGYQTDPIPVSDIDTQTIPVNFHPGYRVYVLPEPLPGVFNSSNILPESGQNNRKTMIGLQVADTKPGGSGFTSAVSIPAILLARFMAKPVQYEPPLATTLKVRPDATAKAAFTFDIKVAPNADGTPGNPFGFKFCRTTEEDVLRTLYNPATVTQILSDLDLLTTDDNYNQRFFELVNLIFDPENQSSFRVFDAIPQPYGFPVPDKSGLTNSSDSLAVKVEKYTQAIKATILPLTAQTPIFMFIKQGTQTDNKQPVIRDINGNLLDASNPAFDPFPMIRKYTKTAEPGTTYVRFTDYTLVASSRRLYFYAIAEVTNQLVAGPLSLFTGPVTILNTIPPEEPIVRTFSILPSTTSSNSPLAVVFQISPTAPYDNITSMRLFRTTNPLLTNSLSTMGSSKNVPVTGESVLGHEITDDFSDMAEMPFGEILYYRIASTRTIINELNLQEEIISVGSDVVAVTLIDTVNPLAPQLTYTSATNTLSWTTVVNKGTYYLYQQNLRGNWTLLRTNNTSVKGIVVQFQLPAPLVTQDNNGNPVYNRFKVRVQNASGLFNLADNILTI